MVVFVLFMLNSARKLKRLKKKELVWQMMLLRAYSRPSVIKQNVVNEQETEIEEERR